MADASRDSVAAAACERTVVVLQPGYMPWLGFFDQMRRADVFVYYDDVQFDKHGWRNRNRIKTHTGPLWLSVPVRHSGLDRPRIVDTRIDSTQAWARKHVRSLEQHYARAPYLSRYLPELEELLTKPWSHLVDLDLALVDLLARWLSIPSAARLIQRSSQLGIDGEKSERLLNLCRHFRATRYLSGNAAQDYLDVDVFARAGVTVEWQNYVHPVYPQQHGEFLPYLSAIDLLLNCGDESASILECGSPQ